MAEPIRRKRKASAKALAEKWGVCARTIRNYVAIPRADYLAQSVSKSKPWVALDMSRATWYRHGKPDPKSV